MLCACSGEQFKLEEEEATAAVPQSPESLATRDFSASGLSSSRTATGTIVDWEAKLEDAQVDEAESTLKEALSLNYEEARALLGRLEYQRGNYDAALQVFQGIDAKVLSPRMSKAIAETFRTPPAVAPQKLRSRGRAMQAGVMSLHSVSLLLEAVLLKVKSLQELGRFKEAARECKIILDTVESALPNGMVHCEISEDCKLLEIFHRSLELYPKLWLQARSLDEAIAAYRRALLKPWKINPQRLAKLQKDLAATLLHGAIVPSQCPKSISPEEESILLLSILLQKALCGEVEWDPEVMDHLTYALTICREFESLADRVEQLLPGVYNRIEGWYFLALCYSAAGSNQTALNLLKKVSGISENGQIPHLAAFLLGAKLSAQDPNEASQGIKYARRVLDLSPGGNRHVLSQAHKFLGVCCGNAARLSVSDVERAALHRESLASLNQAALIQKIDPEIIFRLAEENAVQRNLNLAFDQAMQFQRSTAGSSVRGWELLALIASADQRLKDAEAIIDLALEETGRVDQLKFLRLKAILQIAQQQPKQAIETYKILLVLTQGLSDKTTNDEEGRRLELEAWLDLAGLYSNHGLWIDVDICIQKAKAVEYYSPRVWHATGRLSEAQQQHKEAIVAHSIASSIEPNFVPSIISTAEVLIKMGKESLPLAKSFLMSALRLDPTNHDAWLSLGRIYKMEGLVQQAADAFQAAHELKISEPVQSFL
ncbi:protein NPGR1 [Andrographis paniculata]|uniref:protein NPGR1 n=1 Tax=Andrographis paniculata TaxID=175694 RepID=UPI0021E82863|nr:protein NPGR1 [Andrographis paniculata]